VLRKQHRGFPAGGPAGGPEVFEVALVVSRNTEGDTDQLTKGVVVQEATPKGVLDQSCDTSSSDVSQSPFTAGINLSGKEASGVMARTLTGACNRARDFSHFSNQLLAYPLRVDPIEPTTLQAQVHQEAADARTTIVLNEDFGCVDRPFLRNLKRQLNKAMREVNKGNFLKGMCAMQEATLFSLAPDPDDPDDPDFDPYGSCPDGNPLGPDDPAGEIPSRFLTLAYQIHRLLLEPGPGAFVKYENDPRVLCELSTLPGDVPLDCSDPGPLPACVGL